MIDIGEKERVLLTQNYEFKLWSPILLETIERTYILIVILTMFLLQRVIN